MAYSEFKPTIWSKKIQQQLEKFMVFEDCCNKNFQGEVGQGKRVKIIGAARPTVKTYTPGTNIDSAETPQETSVFLDIDQYMYTNFLVDDIDAAQSDPKEMDVLMKGSAAALAEDRDSFIAGVIQKSKYASASSSANTADKCKALVDAAFTKLWENGVAPGDGTVMILSPWFYQLFKDKIIALSTNNVDMIKRGLVGMYNGADVKVSNNVYNDGTDDYLMVATRNAIAFAGGISKTEPYRPEGQFSDAVKVLDTFGAKIIRPEELYLIKAHNS